MPSKSRKAASRQAQLQRKRRKAKGQQEFDPGPTASEAEDRRSATIADAAAEPEAVVESAALEPQPAPRATRRSRQRGTVESALMYPHLLHELRHIGILAILMGIILAVLTVVLR